MKIKGLGILIVFLLVSCVSRPGFNADLKKQLDDIMTLDQEYREFFDSEITPKRRAELVQKFGITEEQSKNWKIVADQDAKNLIQVEKIISKHGYPGKSLVGEPTNQSAWYVLQHSDGKIIGKYLPLIKKAAKKAEIPFRNYAQMLDRYLMYQKKPQIYGTQGFGGFWFNPKTQKEEWIDFIWPIKEPEKVNELRRKAGFTTTVDENSKEIYGKDFVFKNISLEEAIKISNYKKKWD